MSSSVARNRLPFPSLIPDGLLPPSIARGCLQAMEQGRALFRRKPCPQNSSMAASRSFKKRIFSVKSWDRVVYREKNPHRR
jgi:hypothetical protein